MRKKLLIDGMSCGHCVNHLKTALSEDIQGVNVIEVNLEGKYAIVEMDDSVSKDELKSVIEDIGYELVGIE
ncbi:MULTISPECIES: heavy-metal-associated domain-containing protein [Romboutsia]|uniref:Heavy-metal-associated domain n=1 Tax=Romboutsia hominis TaxID=1507512 RepID=A0A2P2BNV1_9FIRM|nr:MULTISPECIES: heavy metal-associated domain-containing protein [Romboutsia]MCH1959317.1 heavy-metal-associated domain-containing protein [Romboutsia hominis]MCH1970215.1 heavy-metal-associated domain-containing protein [Romboutsia hominis]MDB8792144.1 heavy metal-associated domain-containing protein [Romboutsia sp. 1001216sp1]MDB8797111.1 heavy metal-associated domain-containing protein [Romboutsia sp. 1001216sp1]MDB8798683.1 heavy metal-associated domain-containing protein [Romboutsia sp. 